MSLPFPFPSQALKYHFVKGLIQQYNVFTIMEIIKD